MLPKKLWLLSALLLIISVTQAAAQDTIYTTRGAPIAGEVQSVTRFRVRYYAWGDPDSFLHSIPGFLVVRIRNADGRIWSIRSARDQELLLREAEAHREAHRRRMARPGARNVITLNFPQFQGIGGLTGLAGGIGYERFTNKRGTLSFNIPAYYGHGTNGNKDDLKGKAFYETCKTGYLIPGMHYHPLGNRHKNDLSVGLACFGGVSDVTEHYNENGREVSQTSAAIGVFGFMGQIIYRVHIGSHGLFGLELGYGSITSRSPDNFPRLFQLGMKLGGRF